MFGISPSSITCVGLTLTVNQPKQVIQCQRKALKQTPENEQGLPTLSEPWSFCGINLGTSRSQLLKCHWDKVADFKTMVTDKTSNYTTNQEINTCSAGSARWSLYSFQLYVRLKRNQLFIHDLERLSTFMNNALKSAENNDLLNVTTDVLNKQNCLWNRVIKWFTSRVIKLSSVCEYVSVFVCVWQGFTGVLRRVWIHFHF